MGLEERKFRAAERVSNVLVEEGFDTMEAFELLRDLWAGIIIESIDYDISKGTSKEDARDKVLDITSSFTRSILDTYGKISQ